MFICVFLKGWAHHQICHQVQYLASLLEILESICQKRRQKPCQTLKNTKVKSPVCFIWRDLVSLCFCFHLLPSSVDCLLLFPLGFTSKYFPFLEPLPEQKQLESCIGFRTALVREGHAPKLVLCSVEASVWPYRWSRFESWQGQPGAKSSIVSFCLVFSLPDAVSLSKKIFSISGL